MPSTIYKLLSCLRFARFRVLETPVPLAIYWNLTNRCNLACSYCEIGHKAGDELSTDQLLRMMTEARSMGTFMVNLSGGEPLLRPDLDVILRHLKRLGISTGINTNGVLVESWLDDLCLVDRINISLDGNEESHDSQRGKGSFNKAVYAANRLRSAGIPFGFSCVITQRNYNHVGCVLEIAGDLGVSAVFQPATPWKYGAATINPLCPTTEQIREAIRILKSSGKIKNCIANPPAYFDAINDFPKLKRTACPGGRIACIVSPDGKVWSCDNNTQTDLARDARVLGFQKAFETLTRPPPCDRCSCASAIFMQLAMNLHPVVLMYAITGRGFR